MYICSALESKFAAAFGYNNIFEVLPIRKANNFGIDGRPYDGREILLIVRPEFKPRFGYFMQNAYKILGTDLHFGKIYKEFELIAPSDFREIYSIVDSTAQKMLENPDIFMPYELRDETFLYVDFLAFNLVVMRQEEEFDPVPPERDSVNQPANTHE